MKPHLLTLMYVAALWLGIAIFSFSGSAFAQSSAAPYTTGYRYNLGHQLTGVISPDPDGNGNLHYAAERNTYGPGGTLLKVESGELATWQDETVDPAAWAGFTVSQESNDTYDALGRKLTEAVVSGGVTYTLIQYSYDALGRLECTALRMNPATFGSLPASACALGAEGADSPDRITRYTYDNLNRVLTEQRAYGTALQETYATYTYTYTYTYTANGQQSTVTDANGNLSQMAYDGYDRLTQQYFPSKTTPGQYDAADAEQYAYDANGSIVTLTKRDGQIIQYEYDALSRLSHKHIVNASSPDVYYGYDLRGLQLYARYTSGAGAGVITIYDGFGQVVSSTVDLTGGARTLSYIYDAEGNRTRIIHPDGSYFTYAYDGLNRVQAIFENGTTALISYSYDAMGRRATLTRGGGVASTSYGYDPVSRLSSYAHDLDGVTTTYDVSQSFTRNAASQILTRNLSNGAYAFIETPGINQSYTSNGLNQYTQITSNIAPGGGTPSWDANGNLTSDGSASYAYDIENHLTAATGPPTAQLYYDTLGRLVQVTGTQNTTQMFYDGDALVAEYDGNGTLLRRYVHGAQVDEPLVWYEGAAVATNTRRYFFADHQGSVVAVTNASGATLEIDTYDAYGIPGGQNASRFQYTGQTSIPETGLYYYKARFYSAQLGRFLQTDPIGTLDNLNLYAYVDNDPVNMSDPMGLAGEGGEAPVETVMVTGDRLRRDNYFSYNNIDFDSGRAGSSMVTCCYTPGNGLNWNMVSPDDRMMVGELGFLAATTGLGAELWLLKIARLKGVPKVSKSAQKGIRSLERRIAEHEKKVADFKTNPTVRPGMESQPESAIRAAQESRIRHLEKEIQTFRENIEKLKGGL